MPVAIDYTIFEKDEAGNSCLPLGDLVKRGSQVRVSLVSSHEVFVDVIRFIHVVARVSLDEAWGIWNRMSEVLRAHIQEDIPVGEKNCAFKVTSVSDLPSHAFVAGDIEVSPVCSLHRGLLLLVACLKQEQVYLDIMPRVLKKLSELKDFLDVTELMHDCVCLSKQTPLAKLRTMLMEEYTSVIHTMEEAHLQINLLEEIMFRQTQMERSTFVVQLLQETMQENRLEQDSFKLPPTMYLFAMEVKKGERNAITFGITSDITLCGVNTNLFSEDMTSLVAMSPTIDAAEDELLLHGHYREMKTKEGDYEVPVVEVQAFFATRLLVKYSQDIAIVAELKARAFKRNNSSM